MSLVKRHCIVPPPDVLTNPKNQVLLSVFELFKKVSIKSIYNQPLAVGEIEPRVVDIPVGSLLFKTEFQEDAYK